jgi:mycothiol synthase
MSPRPAVESDFGSLVELVAADEERFAGRPSKIGVADLRGWLAHVDLERDSWVYEDGATAAAFGWVECHGEIGIAVGVVRPGRKGRGLGRSLVARAEERLGELGAARVHQIALASDPGAPGLMAAQGYREVRRFYEMAVEQRMPPAEPQLPEELAIETLDTADARAFHDALDDAFRDHWEHHSLGFDDWWGRHSSSPGFDPTLWFLVRDGGEIAAAVRNDPNRNGGGWVGALGVRRPWRGRGLGRALLLHTFGEFYRRGTPRVSLGVDAENPTGATALYESVGMTVELEQVVYEKALA